MTLAPLPLLLLLLPGAARAEGTEAEFTIQVEHYEQAALRGHRATEYRGRVWDLRNVLDRNREPSGLELVQAENKHLGETEGYTYCVRVRPVAERASRGQAVANLIERLKQRDAEMRAAGAYFKVESPSSCADRPARRLAEGPVRKHQG